MKLLKYVKKTNVRWETSFFERDGLRVLLHSMASQLLGFRHLLKVGRERLEQHHDRLAASHLSLERWYVSLVSSFVWKVTRLVSDEVAAHSARLTTVVATVSDSFTEVSIYIVEFRGASERGGECLSPAQRRQKRLLSCFWSLVSTDRVVNHACPLWTSVIFSYYT